jgi:hypothetical protein
MKADKHVLRVVPLNEQVLTDWRHHLRPCFAEWSDWWGNHQERIAAGFAKAQLFTSFSYLAMTPRYLFNDKNRL